MNVKKRKILAGGECWLSDLCVKAAYIIDKFSKLFRSVVPISLCTLTTSVA